ncbi:MAG: radical SAM protein [Deltaproteobacteria bacterium]|nr:radical SAM protein [Deltaproteobacteria bacterium]
MSLYLQNDPRLFFGRKSILVAEPETRLSEHTPGYFPRKMIMSLTSKCNLRCKHCMRDKCRDMGGETMPREMIDHVVKVFFPKISCMQIGGIDFGEQMLSPHFGYFLRRAGEHGVGLDLITNGTLINRDNAPLLASTVTRALISVEGMGPNYGKIRGVEWERLRKNMALLLDARAKSERDEPLIACLNVCVIREFRDD